MTAKQLIELLQQVEDDSLDVYIQDGSCHEIKISQVYIRNDRALPSAGMYPRRLFLT